MKYSAAAVVAALAAGAAAKPTLLNSDYNIQEGQPFVLKWSGASGPVTIKVANGPSSNLTPVLTIDSGDSSTSFTWTPPTSLPSGTYAFEISDSTGTNYSPQFTYAGSGTSSSASTGSSTATTSGSTSTSATTTTTSTASITTSANSTTTTHTKSGTSTTSSTTSSNTVRPTINNNDSYKAQSPVAFVLVTVAALLYLY